MRFPVWPWRLHALLGLLLVLAFPLSSAATIYYVATSGGLNSRSCATATNSATPKQTIGGPTGGWACATVPGDIIDVRAGTYSETLSTGDQTLTSGTAGSPMILRGHTGETVTIRPSSGCNVVDFRGAESRHHWTFDGINMDGRNLNCGASTANMVSINGGSTDITLQNLSLLDVSNPGGGTTTAVNGAADNVTLSHVVVDGTHKTFGDHQGSHCIYLAVPGDNNLVEFSTLKNCGGYGIQYNDSAQLGVGGNTGGIIRNNLVINNGCCSSSKGGIVVGQNIRTTKVYNNIVANNGTESGIDLNGANNTDNEVYNNTIYNHGYYCIASNMALRPLIKNNLCSGSGLGVGLFAGTSNAVVTKNLVFSVTTVSNLGTGNTISGTLTSNPLLVNPGASDWHLQAGSPAIGAGETLAAVTTDYAGTSRVGTAYDIGAYKFGAAAPATFGTFYMSTTGSDGVTCSAALNPLTPKRSFASVLPCMASGSTLYLRAGTYATAGDRLDSTTQTIIGGSSFSQPTTIAAFPGEVVTLAPPLTGTEAMVTLTTSGNAYLVLDRLQFNGGTVVGEGVSISGSAHHVRVQNAVMTGLMHYCFHVDGTAGNELLTSTCTSNGTNPHIFLNNGASGTLIRGNDVSQMAEAGITDKSFTGTPNSGNIIRDNLFHDTQAGGTLPAIIVGFGNNDLVANNRIWNTSGGIWLAANVSNPQVYHNTITQTTLQALYIDPTVTGAQVVNTVLWANATGIIDDSGTALLLTNVTTDPLFVDAPGHDYRLKATSPAINSGTSVTTVPGLATVLLDAVGTLRPQGSGMDIGALEFLGSLAPGGPTNLVLTTIVTGAIDSVTLAWDYTPTDLYRGTYTVYRQTGCTGPFVRRNVSLIRATTLGYTDSLVQPGTTYCWMVRALNADGVESVDSNIVTYAAAPYARGTIVLSVGLTGGPTVYAAHLTWTFANGTPATTGFNVYRTDSCGLNGRTKLNGSLLTTGTLTFDDANQINGKTHCWQIVGQDATTTEVLFSNQVLLPIPALPSPTGILGATGGSVVMGGRR